MAFYRTKRTLKWIFICSLVHLLGHLSLFPHISASMQSKAFLILTFFLKSSEWHKMCPTLNLEYTLLGIHFSMVLIRAKSESHEAFSNKNQLMHLEYMQRWLIWKYGSPSRKLHCGEAQNKRAHIYLKKILPQACETTNANHMTRFHTLLQHYRCETDSAVSAACGHHERIPRKVKDVQGSG